MCRKGYRLSCCIKFSNVNSILELAQFKVIKQQLCIFTRVALQVTRDMCVPAEILPTVFHLYFNSNLSKYLSLRFTDLNTNTV